MKKLERLAELNAMLNMDEKGEKIFWQMKKSERIQKLTTSDKSQVQNCRRYP